MLRRLAWSSVPSASFTTACLNDIVARARSNNERHHVSGMLLFTGAAFLGVHEGTEWDLADLWHKLSRDDRHVDLHLISDELCGVRWFPTWNMTCVDHDAFGAQIETLRLAERTITPGFAQTIHPIMQRARHMSQAATPQHA